MIKLLMPIILLFVFSCSGPNNDSVINNNLDNSAKHDLPKIECVDKLEAYILKAETLGQKDKDQIRRMFEDLTEVCTGISRDEMNQPAFSGLSVLEYPELLPPYALLVLGLSLLALLLFKRH